MSMRLSRRLTQLPPYLFAEIDRLKGKAIAEGVDLIDFGIGDPDRATPEMIIDELCRQAWRRENHRYPAYRGMAPFRAAVADYYARRGVPGLDADKEIIALIGSKEGIAHLPLAVIDPGDIVLIPDPGYPVYLSSTLFAGGTPYFMPLKAERDFLPDFETIPPDVLARTRLMFLNYPNNPTTATASPAFFAEACGFARRHGIIICHDASYLDITFDGYRAPSLLEIPEAKELAIEMISLSKNFNMTGWRIAAAAGNPEIVQALLRIKTNIDSGVFNPIQHAGAAALNRYGGPDPETMAVYGERRRLLLDCLDELGWPYHATRGTFYVWVKTPSGWLSMDFVKELLQRFGILVTPGIGFGNQGEGYIRFSLTLPTEAVAQAVERLRQSDFKPYST